MKKYCIVILILAGMITLGCCLIIKPPTPVNIKMVFAYSIIVSAVLMILMNRLIKYLSEIRYLKSPLSTIDRMSGEEFEVYLKTNFEKSGYKVELTPLSNDYGADLICTKKNEILVVQAKRYEGKVGTAAVQQIVAARDYYEADRCMVITNSYFTRNAYSLAEANDVTLVDRDSLLNNNCF